MSTKFENGRRVYRGISPAIVAIGLAMLSVQNTDAQPRVQQRLGFPNPDPGGPVYARVERPFQLHTRQVAAILFYRDPTCVPETFNLLDNVDLEGFPTNARAFRCAPTIDGFQLWTTFPFPGPPNQVFTRGTGAVPVWFVSWDELQSALADDKLTIVELRSMRSLQIGHAIHFEETLLLTQTAATQDISGAASGDLLDGRSFEFAFELRNGRLVNIRIKLQQDHGPKWPMSLGQQ